MPEQTNLSRLNRRQLVIGASVGLTFFIPSRSRAASAAYEVTEFHLPDDVNGPAVGRGINRKATVVGIVMTKSGPQAVRSTGKEMRLLAVKAESSVANAINDAGRTVGARELEAAWWETDGKAGVLSPGKDAATAYAVNRSNVIVGSVDSGANLSTAFVFDVDHMVELATLGGPSSRALAINDYGVVAGYSTEDEAGEHIRAVMWIDEEVQSIGTLGGDGSQAFAINKSGTITGCATADDTFGAVDTAFIYRDGEMSALTRLNKANVTGRKNAIALERSVGLSLNDDGIIVGASMSVSENNPISVASLWDADHVVDLNTLIGDVSDDVILTSADGINIDREIIATGHRVGDDGSNTRIYRLTPA